MNTNETTTEKFNLAKDELKQVYTDLLLAYDCACHQADSHDLAVIDALLFKAKILKDRTLIDLLSQHEKAINRAEALCNSIAADNFYLTTFITDNDKMLERLNSTVFKK
jgi:hypothetical protein